MTKLGTVDPKSAFVGVSGMTRKSSEGIISGRPFGGVAILWNKCLSSCITLADKDEVNGRFISILVKGFTNEDIILSCIYLPCLSLRQAHYTVEASSVIAYVDNSLTKYVVAVYIIGGDFNFSCSDICNYGYALIANSIRDFDLLCCDKFCNSGSYTYHHDSLGHSSWIDYFLCHRL